MIHAKLGVLFIGMVFALTCCFSNGQSRFVIADSKLYDASIFRQRCAICHGPEAEGRKLDDGKQVPSLRQGEFKFKSEDEIYNQIANGGNGMTPFRGQLTERELRMMAAFVHDRLRSQ
ncbi:MAG: cytochrome c [Acidobacteriota bacterium]